jgi:hypothetical protein
MESMNLTARPYDTNFSGNGIWYAFYSEAAANDPTISFDVRLRFLRNDSNSLEYNIGVSLQLIPYQGKAAINISSLVDAELEFGLPSLVNPTDITTCNTQTGHFYLEFREITAENANPGWDGSEGVFPRPCGKRWCARISV